jgi:hypothetical protein
MPKLEGGGSAAKSVAAGKGMIDKAAEKAKAAEAAKVAKEKAAKQKELEKAKADKAKELAKAKDEKAKAKATAAAAKAKEKEAKAAEMAKKKEERAKAKAEKDAAKIKDPEWVEQLDEKGNTELVDKNKFPFEVACSVCGSIRYVNQSGLLMVDKCKMHARKERRKRRMEKVRAKMKNYKAIVTDALAAKLFPAPFMKKYNLG